MADNVKYRFIQNVGDFFPSGYFSDDFIDKVQKSSGLSNDEMTDLCSPFVQLRKEYDSYKNYIVNSNPRVKDAILHTHDFNTKLLEILGYKTNEAYTFYSVDEENQAVVPVRNVLTRGGNTTMLVMEMQHLIKIGNSEPSGLFAQSYNVDLPEGVSEQTVKHQQYYAGQWSEVYTLPEDTRISPSVINKAIDSLFLLPKERRPHFILMMAGNEVFLLDEDKWPRGAYLEFSLDELFSQASIPVFKKYYALFHLLVCKETLAADSEEVLMDKLVEDSYKSAYEVTKDLKQGVIHAVETIANEALYWWKQHDNIPVSDYTDDTFEAKVKDDCLTIVYRLLFLFFAESRDDLDVLPSKSNVYKKGYSLEMLRDLEKVKLITDESRNGYYIHETLTHLFNLISTGYRELESNTNNSDKSFFIRHIDSPLFDKNSLTYLKDVKLRNVQWQDIICQLSLSHRNRQVGRISYANLGVNQLGSVYESLLAYRGFYAEEDYIEVHKIGDTKETYLVPASRMDDFEHEEILCDENESPIRLKEGTFVYRLNGRDRQKSASYYTPEILTRSTVKYTLKGILDDVREGKRKAEELLELKILEPAMGAAAFQNEVINQLAEAYLTYMQEQRRKSGIQDWRVPTEHYRDELQKVKAYIATHNVYGVDLNPTAIELGKLSLWLNVIHKDMETPFFSNRLALGNAVIGAWLKVYNKEEFYGKSGRTRLEPNEWWTKSPHKIKFHKTSVNRSVNEIYHFLLPDKNMLGVRSIKEQKEAYKNEYKHMNDMIADWTGPITGDDFVILQRISAKIDVLLKEYFEFQTSIEKLTNNKHNVWPHTTGESHELFGAENYAEKQELNDSRFRHDNAYFRLKMVMDYWCSLWFWEYKDAFALPTRTAYWQDIEALLNVSNEQLDTKTKKALERSGLPTDDEGNGTDEKSGIITLSKTDILTKTKGAYRTFFDDSNRFKLVHCYYANRYHFFHPMLEFLEVFWLRDGFDIICGNPPWLKLEFDEQGVIAEKYPEIAIRKVSAPEARKMRDNLFSQSTLLEQMYRDEETEQACSTAFMNANCNYPLLQGQQTNLYKCVLENGFSLMNEHAFMGLLHPETVYDDPKGQPLRKEIYKRLRYHFQYHNELSLFAEVHHSTKYGSQIYGSRRENVDFLSIHNLFHPNTVDGCFVHDGHGICGGIKDENGNWNQNAHKDRIVHFTETELKVLSEAFEDGADWESVKLTSIHASVIVSVLEKLSKFPKHVRDYEEKIITRDIEETSGVEKGYIEKTNEKVDDSYDVVYSGPHFYVLNPFYKSPYKNYRVNNDYDVVNSGIIEEDYKIRVLYKRKEELQNFKKIVQGFCIKKDSEGNDVCDNWIDHYKFAYRRMLGPNSERTFIGSIICKGNSHLHTVNSITFKDTKNIVEIASIASSLPIDFFVKVLNASDLTENRMACIPMGISNKFKTALFNRTLILNCLSITYTDLWHEMWQDEYKQDQWSKQDSRLKPFDKLHKEWSWDIPLRNYFERRQALVEIDVISAMALGLTLEDLEMIYNIQFPVLQQNEDDTWYDQKGNIVFTCSKGLTGVGVDRPVWEKIRDMKAGETYEHTIDPKKSELYGGQKVTYYAPFEKCDRIEDYKTAWRFFEEKFK